MSIELNGGIPCRPVRAIDTRDWPAPAPASIRPTPQGQARTSQVSTSAEAGSIFPATEEVSSADDRLFNVMMSAFYHRTRITWFAGLHRTGMFSNILASTAVIAFIRENETAALVPALVLALVMSANLAFDFAGLARSLQWDSIIVIV